MLMAKRSGIPVFLVGHVTKEGAIAGPKLLEHMVDTVLYFEGDRNHVFRILRAVKNRFGSTNEIGVFEMKGKGLWKRSNPSAIFLSERPVNAPGSVVTASMEGTRPILVELQALASSSSFGTARRTILGLDQNRVALLVAVMEKKLGMQLMGHDIFMNVAGGVKIWNRRSTWASFRPSHPVFWIGPFVRTPWLSAKSGLQVRCGPLEMWTFAFQKQRKMGFTSMHRPGGQPEAPATAKRNYPGRGGQR
jgi:hypothetical protein